MTRIFGQRWTLRELAGDVLGIVALVAFIYLLLLFGAAFQTGWIG